MISHFKIYRNDLSWAGILSITMFILVLVGYHKVSPYILHYSTWDYWFDCDTPAVAGQLLDRFSSYNYRISHHPLFSILLYPFVQVLIRIFKIGAEYAFGLVLALTSAVWIFTVFFHC